jgi:ABC-2 type transport system permease protein
LAFTNITANENFKDINVAVVNNSAYQKNEYFKSFLEKLSKGKDKVFNLTVAGKAEAEKLLDNSKVDGYILVDTNVSLVVKESGLNQSIIKSVLDEYIQTSSAVTSISAANPSAIQNGLLQSADKRLEYTKNLKLGTKDKPDSIVNYFYSLIAMSCFYGSFFGLKQITDTQADLSKYAARLNVAPVHKLTALMGGLLAGFVVLLAEITILVAYLIFILKVDFGDQMGYIFLTCFVGCAAGITFGSFVASVVKKGEGVKTAIILGGTMVASFLSGMMSGYGNNIKYIIGQKVPLLAYINPVSLIADTFYTLYYYDTHTRFFINIALLCGFTVLFSLCTYLVIRRQKYASI